MPLSGSYTQNAWRVAAPLPLASACVCNVTDSTEASLSLLVFMLIGNFRLKLFDMLLFPFAT